MNTIQKNIKKIVIEALKNGLPTPETTRNILTWAYSPMDYSATIIVDETTFTAEAPARDYGTPCDAGLSIVGSMSNLAVLKDFFNYSRIGLDIVSPPAPDFLDRERARWSELLERLAK